MKTSQIAWGLGLVVALGCRMQAQVAPASGVYEIVSGTYSECCGFAGVPLKVVLPHPSQSYLRLSVDVATGTASLQFLAQDVRTVSSRIPCPGGTVEFGFDKGLLLPGRIAFDLDPIPLQQDYWSYEVGWGGNAIQVHGKYRAASIRCFDVPTNFDHTNVTAVLVPPPTLTLLNLPKTGGARLRVQGRAGWTVTIEASDDAKTWTTLASRVMDYSLCPICPYADVEDVATSPSRQRFYRARQTP